MIVLVFPYFSDDRYFVFNDNHLNPEFHDNGRPITELGFPESIKRIDAAFVWKYNKKTYFISGDIYCRFNEKTGTMDQDYPRPMKYWKNVKLNVTSVFAGFDGKLTRYYDVILFVGLFTFLSLSFTF